MDDSKVIAMRVPAHLATAAEIVAARDMVSVAAIGRQALAADPRVAEALRKAASEPAAA
jgi:hypothetical protein